MVTAAARATTNKGTPRSKRSGRHATVEGAESKTLRKALGLLEVIAAHDRPMTIAELAGLSGVSRPTTHRLVHTLARDGYVEINAESGRVGIGLTVLPFASHALDRNRLRLESLPHLRALTERTQQRTNLGVLHRNQVLYLAGVERPSMPMVYSRFGKTAPAHCSSLGKAILAYMPTEDVDEILRQRPLERFTETTITTRDALDEELAKTKRRGYAIDMGELRPQSICIAAPIFDEFDRPAGAIGISGREIEPLLSEVATVRHTAEIITHLISKEDR